MTLEDVYILVAPLDTWSMDDMERQRRARYQKSRGEHAGLLEKSRGCLFSPLVSKGVTTVVCSFSKSQEVFKNPPAGSDRVGLGRVLRCIVEVALFSEELPMTSCLFFQIVLFVTGLVGIKLDVVSSRPVFG